MYVYLLVMILFVVARNFTQDMHNHFTVQVYDRNLKRLHLKALFSSCSNLLYELIDIPIALFYKVYHSF